MWRPCATVSRSVLWQGVATAQNMVKPSTALRERACGSMRGLWCTVCVDLRAQGLRRNDGAGRWWKGSRKCPRHALFRQ